MHQVRATTRLSATVSTYTYSYIRLKVPHFYVGVLLYTNNTSL